MASGEVLGQSTEEGGEASEATVSSGPKGSPSGPYKLIQQRGPEGPLN